MTEKLSAAEQYARLKADRFESFIESSFSSEALKDIDLFEVKTPSGQTFKCRKLDKAFITNTGQMPMALTESLITQGGSEDAMAQRFNEMTDIEKRASLQATAAMVRYICVEPRLVIGEVGNRQNAISVDMLTMDDFKCLVEWAKTGGGTAEGLKTFRHKRK